MNRHEREVVEHELHASRLDERALDLGGSEVLHGRGDDGKSQWAVLLDPNGAAFGVIPVISEDQAPPRDGAASGDGGTALRSNVAKTNRSISLIGHDVSCAWISTRTGSGSSAHRFKAGS